MNGKFPRSRERERVAEGRGRGRGARGNSIPAKVEAGLEHSRVLVLCMSANAFGSDWAQLACPAEASERRRKAGTCGSGNLPFRDPLNEERLHRNSGFPISIRQFKMVPR